MNWYDREGKPLPSKTGEDYQHIEALLTDSGYKRVAQTTLPDGRWVSTVWMGIDHNFGNGPPLIFETMVFKSRKDRNETDCERYSTLAEAVAGHERIVAQQMGNKLS